MYKVIGQYEFHSPVFDTIEDARQWIRSQVERAGEHCVIGAHYSDDGAITITAVSGSYKETFEVVEVRDAA